MSKFHFSIIATLCICFILLSTIDEVYKTSLPKIALPRKAQNTIGSIPIIEHYDDGRLDDLEKEYSKKLKQAKHKYAKVEQKYKKLEEKYKNKNKEIKSEYPPYDYYVTTSGIRWSEGVGSW